MRQTLHLLFVHVESAAALATWYRSRWVLPIATTSPRARAAAAVRRWAADRRLPASLAGQWLGRIGSDDVEWLMVATLDARRVPEDAQLQWTELRDLDPSSALLEYQAWAVSRAMAGGDLPHLAGPFGDLTWIDGVRRWIEASAGSLCGCPTVYRAGPFDVVVSAPTVAGDVYFKGLSSPRAGEISLTRALARLAPSAFAETLAEERQRDATWWLTAACPGAPATADDRVARALAHVQRITEDAAGDLLKLDLRQVTGWADALIGETVAPAANAATDRLLELTESWIPMDIHPTNVLVDGAGSVRFIDLDDSFRGPAALAMATYERRCGAFSLHAAYEDAWESWRTRPDWAAVDLMSTLVETWLGWRRLLERVATAEVFVDLDAAAARVRDRLLRHVQRR